MAHASQHVEVWQRREDGWKLHEVDAHGAATLESIGCELPLEEIYRDPLK